MLGLVWLDCTYQMCLLQDRRAVSLHWPPPQFHWAKPALCLKRRQPMKASFLFRTTPGQPPSLCSNGWTGASLSTILPFPSSHFLVKPPWEDLTLSSKSFDCLFVPLTVCLADTEVWSLQENELVLSLRGYTYNTSFQFDYSFSGHIQFYNVVLITLLYFWIIILRDNWGVSFHN